MSLPDERVKSQFQYCFETANFCLQFNNMEDILNCKNKFSKHDFNIPLNESNFSVMH